MSSARGEQDNNIKSQNESTIPGIYQEVKSSLEFMLNKMTNKSSAANINMGPLDTKSQKRYQSSSILKSSIMSLEQILDAKNCEPSQTNQVIQYFDIQSRIHLIKLH